MDPIDELLNSARQTAAKISGSTELIRAASRLDEDSVRRLLEAGSEVGTPDKQGRTPLHEAVRQSYQDKEKGLRITTLLLDAGHPIDPVERLQGLTPLYEAAIYADAAIVKLLLDRGANVNHQARDKNTPLRALTATTTMMRGRAKVIKLLEGAGGVGRLR